VPFRYGDENENVLPDGLSEDEFRKLIVAAVADGVVEMLQKALDEQLFIIQENGVRVCRLTGKIVDPETDRPRGKK